jgi:hypothetical protein
MPIWVSGSTREDASVPPGEYQAVCCDVLDLGDRDIGYGFRRYVKVVWQLGPEHKHATIGRMYAATLAPRSSLRTMLEQWRGRPLSAEDVMRFDLERVIGVQAVLVTGLRNTQAGVPVATVTAVLPPKQGQKVPLVVPRRDAPAAKPPAQAKGPVQKAPQMPTVDDAFDIGPEELGGAGDALDDDTIPF